MFEKVVVLDSVIFFPEHRRRLEAIAKSIVEYDTCTSEEEVSQRCQGADCIISCWVDIPNRIMDENPQLKAVAFWTHDYEHRIDAEYARSRGIYVPAIPDYGTDSVAELVFIGLLRLLKDSDGSGPHREEEIVARFGDDVRLLSENVKDTLGGRWIHEYVKTGQLRIDAPRRIPAETLKGMTLGVLGADLITEPLVRAVAHGLRMNLIYAVGDAPYAPEVSFRPIDDVLADSQVLVCDSRSLPEEITDQIDARKYLSCIDVADLDVQRASLAGRTLGIVGLGRIGSRVAQIAVEGFGMQVRYYSRTRKPELESRLGLIYSELDEVLSGSDIISLHLPHIGAEDFLSRDMVEKIPAGTVVVNCGVGAVIGDEDHLLDRCGRGELRAFLDVYRSLPPKDRLRALQGQVLATYRLGWRTKATVGLKTHKLLTKLSQLPVREASS